MTTTAAAPLMISVSGVRGIIGQTLTPEVATAFGQAFGHFLKTQNSGLLPGLRTMDYGLWTFSPLFPGHQPVG